MGKRSSFSGPSSSSNHYHHHRGHRTPGAASLSSSSIINKSANWLKFSNSSVTWARTRHQRNNNNGNNGQDSNDNQNDSSQQQSDSIANDGSNYKRRKFFNNRTEFAHVFTLMLMSLCRQITNRSLLNKRLITYFGFVFVGGLLKDFAGGLLRALMFSLSPSNPLNQYMVKWAWFWDIVLLVPMITLSSSLIRQHLDRIQLNQIEQSIEDYLQAKSTASTSTTEQRKSSLKSISSPLPLLNGGSNTNGYPTIVTLESLSAQHHHLNLMEQFRRRHIAAVATNQTDNQKPISFIERIRKMIINCMHVSMVKDVWRIVICTALYYGCISMFSMVQLMTTKSGRTIASSNDLSLISGKGSNMTPDGIASGFDISGHVFILIYSNLMILEECTVMFGWEPLGDRLYSLCLECTNIEINHHRLGINSNQESKPLMDAEHVQRLQHAWHRYQRHTVKLRTVFFLATIMTVLWDFMIIQTTFFYHTLIEKMIALITAYVCWFIAYRLLFPMFNLNVRSVNNSTKTTGAATIGQ